MKIYLPIRTVSESNQSEHWAFRARRAQQQRSIAVAVIRSELRQFGYLPPHLITMTRIALRRLDVGNLATSMKHVQDGVADALGINDGDARISWLYAQRKGKPQEYAVEVEIE